MLQKLTKQLKKKSSDLTEEFDEDHALDEVMNSMVEDLEEEPTGISEEELQGIIDQSGLKEAVANIQQEMRDDIDQITKDFEVAVSDGIDELEAEEEAPIEEKPAAGLVDQKMEQRTVKSQPSIEEDMSKFRKGPLWQFRTSHQDDDKVID